MITLLPGYNDSASYQLRFPLLARRCNRAGFNVATLVPPYTFNAVPASARRLTLGIAFFGRNEQRKRSPKCVP